MHDRWIQLCLLALMGLGALAQAQAVEPQSGVNSNPLGSPIRRINPNSRQGTVPSNPAQRQGVQVSPEGRPPTLENRGIGNGQQFPRAAPTAPRGPGVRR
jgi:hypothetical protein